LRVWVWKLKQAARVVAFLLRMISGIIGKKLNQSQGFLEDGRVVPFTRVVVSPNVVTQIKTIDSDGYMAVQLGIEDKKKATKGELGHSKKAGLEKAPRFLREIRLSEAVSITPGTKISLTDVLKPGDIIDVSGISKGKGFAGGVKRYHFKGGPRTHGQSDRERAPGSIGQTTTPGRVYKGKRMAGKMGFETKTVKNLIVLSVEGDTVLIKGQIPGYKGALVTIEKVGEDKKFTPLIARVKAEEVVANENAPIEEVAEAKIENIQEQAVEQEQKEETKEEAK